jgi:hypothetical protein
MGPPSNKQANDPTEISMAAVGGNSSSFHAGSTASASGADFNAPYKPTDNSGAYNGSTFGANSGIANLSSNNQISNNNNNNNSNNNNNNNSYGGFEGLTQPNTTSTTGEGAGGGGAGASVSLLDPLASLLGPGPLGSEFSLGGGGAGGMNVGFNSNSIISDAGGVSGLKKNNSGYNFSSSSNHNNASEEEKQYGSNNHLQAGFDSYMGGQGDANRYKQWLLCCVEVTFCVCNCLH